MLNTYFNLPRSENQALGLGHYAIDFLRHSHGAPAAAVLARVEAFHRDSVACAVAALAEGCQAPVVLRQEALEYARPKGACCFGSATTVAPEKAVVANCSAVRELDANGTNFGYNPDQNCVAGEFGHNDFYPVAVAAAQQTGRSGSELLRAFVCLDEIRGRLAECFSLKTHKIDHVVHGAIASAAVYGALLGASPAQIESAIGQVVAHYVPFRAIRHGSQLSDSKGASAALSAETAVLAVHRALRGFQGPGDIFRNPQALFCLFEPPARPHESPFDLRLACAGNDFAVQGMHFKLGLYEHQSAGALQALLDLLAAEPRLGHDWQQFRRVRVAIYEPAYSIIADPHKRDPRTRQSADHSLYYIVATLLRKACELKGGGWRELMLLPADYRPDSLFHPVTRAIMERIEVVPGGPEFDALYPEGIPTAVTIEHTALGTLESGRILFPLGHARNTSPELEPILATKLERLCGPGVPDVAALAQSLSGLAEKTPAEVRGLYSFPIHFPPQAGP